MEGIPGAVVATIGIFLPSFLFIVAALPFLSELRKHASFQGILMGVNASVVGILLAAFYDHVIKSSIFDSSDFALAVVLFALLKHASFQGILMGVNVSVVCILLSVFYDPVIISSIFDTSDFALGVVLFAFLNIWKLPAWLIVILGLTGGYIISFMGF